MTIALISKLTSDIRELDSAHDLQAAELAEALVGRGWIIPTTVSPEEKWVFAAGDTVEVNTDWGWSKGIITEIYPFGLISVHTERGPVSVMTGAKRIRKITNV